MSDATFYAWKKKYAHLGVSELRRLRQLEEEHSRVKRLVADLSLDTHRLSEALRKNVYGPPAVEHWPPGVTARVRSVPAGLPLGAVWAGVVVSPTPREGAIRLADTDSRSGPCAPAIGVSAHWGAPASRRVAGESETGATALSTGGLAAADAGPAAQASRGASWPGHEPDRSY